MMEAFLEKLSDHILKNYGHQLAQLSVVFPNKRAGLFLKQQLAEKITDTSWLPLIYTIDEAITGWTGINLADPLKLRFDLMEIHLDLNMESSPDMAEFAGWADQFILDFDEIDHHLVDAASLYDYLSEAKALELWHPDGSPLSPYEKDYLRFYRLLILYYNRLKNRLQQQMSAYRGMLVRQMAEDKTSDFIENIATEKVIFAGFNALTPAEQKVISLLTNKGIAEVIWDLDAYYFNENTYGRHEAGHFARLFFKKSGQQSPNWVGNSLLESAKQLNIIGVPGHVSQAKAFANDFLQGLKTDPSLPDKSALVLADESLLTAAINSVPEQAGNFNLTMGLPFQYSPVYQIIVLLFNIQLNAANSKQAHKVQTRLVLELLSHSVWNTLLDTQTSSQLKTERQKHINSGKLFIPLKDFMPDETDKNQSLQKLFSHLFRPWESDLQACFQSLQSLISYLADLLFKKPDSQAQILLLNHLSAAGRIINKLSQLLETKASLIDLPGLKKLFIQLSPAAHISLYGEPLEGLQVMGLLETRNLDFQHVYLLSANEGILPGDKSSQSLIPFDIRKQFGLPSHFEKQAIYAYHFFRLLQYASEISIYYNTEPDVLGGGEKSRYIMQIEHELSRLNPRLTINHSIFTFPLQTIHAAAHIQVEKDPSTMALLEQKAASGFSPTSLAAYVSCPLKFYLQELMGLRKAEELEESIGMDVLGTIVHNTLEELYLPFKQKVISRQHILDMKSKAADTLKGIFARETKSAETAFGKNRLIAEVADSFVQQFLNLELKQLEEHTIEVIELERRFETFIETNNTRVKLKGLADRIDRRDDMLHIIDYKTGKVDTRDLKCDTWEQLITNPKKTKALQLLIYSYLYLKNNPSAGNLRIQSNIVSMRNLSDGLMHADFPGESFTIEDAENVLLQLLDSIFDRSLPFAQTTSTDTCSYCEFKALCNR